MIAKSEIIQKAKELGFEDVGFTGAQPFETQKEILVERSKEYAWATASGLDLMAGCDPANILPEAKSIIVLLEGYFKKAFPKSMEPFFGRCYLDDDRVTQDGLSMRIKAFRDFLKSGGIKSKVPFHLPHRLAAGRAGLGTFGKNCLFYSTRAVRQSSWVLPIAFVVDEYFEPDEPTLCVGCPSFCKNACITACPTGALKGPRKIDPRLCISYLSYFGDGITPRELREPMGLYIYGCDRCQSVCPRNLPWLAMDLPVNERVAKKAPDFDPVKLLHMDRDYFMDRIWPHMFYMPESDIWRWKMNTARSLGNTRDEAFVPELAKAFDENADERVKSMCAWAIGRIGGKKAKTILEGLKGKADKICDEEIDYALSLCS
jgi:epoxyqueuosine reductase